MQPLLLYFSLYISYSKIEFGPSKESEIKLNVEFIRRLELLEGILFALGHMHPYYIKYNMEDLMKYLIDLMLQLCKATLVHPSLSLIVRSRDS